MQSLQSVLFTLINHEAVTGTIRMTQLFTHHSSHSQRRTLAGHMTVGEGIQQTCRLGCYLVKARVHSLATVIGQSPNTDAGGLTVQWRESSVLRIVRYSELNEHR